MCCLVHDVGCLECGMANDSTARISVMWYNDGQLPVVWLFGSWLYGQCLSENSQVDENGTHVCRVMAQ